MNWRGLNNSAAWRDNPMETFCLRELPYWATCMTTTADLQKMLDLLLHNAKIQAGSEGVQSLLVKVDQHVQKTLGTTENDDTNIDTLTTLY
jgi:hypothetical protein